MQAIPETGPMKFVDRPHDVVQQQHNPRACQDSLSNSLLSRTLFPSGYIGGATGNTKPSACSPRPSFDPPGLPKTPLVTFRVSIATTYLLPK